MGQSNTHKEQGIETSENTEMQSKGNSEHFVSLITVKYLR